MKVIRSVRSILSVLGIVLFLRIDSFHQLWQRLPRLSTGFQRNDLAYDSVRVVPTHLGGSGSSTVDLLTPKEFVQHEFPIDKLSVPLKLVSFNILAPCYKRLKQQSSSQTTTSVHPASGTLPPKVYESHYEDLYLERNEKICDQLLSTDADIICLQEFWTGSPSLIQLYLNKLCHNGKYSMKLLERTSHWRSRKDGLAIFVKNKSLQIEDVREILFHDCGDRVALMLLLSVLPDKIKQHLPPSLLQSSKSADLTSIIRPQRFICVNTHLLFPHNEYSTKIRLREITKILGFVDTYRQRELVKKNQIKSYSPSTPPASLTAKEEESKLPVIICGDFNGSPRGKVYSFVKSQNYKSACENCVTTTQTVLQPPHSEQSNQESSLALTPCWVSHQNHLNTNVFVDHIFYLNPSEQHEKKGFKTTPDWTNLVYQELMEKIQSKYIGQTLRDVFNTFDQDNSNYITKEEFMIALEKLGFIGEDSPALTKEEIEILLQSADSNNDGNIDYKEFYDRFWIASDEMKNNTGKYYYDDKNVLTSITSSSSTQSSSITPTDLTEELTKQRFSFARTKFLSTSFAKREPVESNAHPPAMPHQKLEDAIPLGDLQVANLTITPKYLESGEWPHDYQLSDHGMLECVFNAQVSFSQ
eukprot:gene2542-2703_t